MDNKICFANYCASFDKYMTKELHVSKKLFEKFEPLFKVFDKSALKWTFLITFPPNNYNC